MRFFIELSFNGDNYHGWQIQPNVITMIGEVIRNLVDEHEMTILLIEQYVDFVRKYADTFAVMNRGRFVAEGTVDELDSNTIHKHLSV